MRTCGKSQIKKQGQEISNKVLEFVKTTPIINISSGLTAHNGWGVESCISVLHKLSKAKKQAKTGSEADSHPLVKLRKFPAQTGLTNTS